MVFYILLGPQVLWNDLRGNSYQAEALTNVLRYHTCRSRLREDRKLPITKLKWDARTVTIFPVITHIGFSHFSGVQKTQDKYMLDNTDGVINNDNPEKLAT